MKHGGHEKYVEHLKAVNAKEKAHDDSLDALRMSFGATREKYEKLDKEETMEETDIDAMQEEIAKTATSYFAANHETFMLGEPLQLTVLRRDGRYSKRSHIGGEDFKPIRAYIGKRGKLIYVFRPVMVSDYEHMEMEDSEACEKLTGFKDYIKHAAGSEFERLNNETKRAAADRAEREKLAGREEQYAHLGFGSF